MITEKRGIKVGKKGQSANEAAMMITFMTFFLIITLAAISDDIITASDNNYKALLQDIADVIEQEAQIAFGSENGYYHPFTLPPQLNGQAYITSILNSSLISGQANITIITVASKRPNVPLNVTKVLPRDVLGNLVRGQNTVRKEQSIVIFRPIPLTAAQQADCSATCGKGGSVLLEECCDQMQLCCT